MTVPADSATIRSKNAAGPYQIKNSARSIQVTLSNLMKHPEKQGKN